MQINKAKIRVPESIKKEGSRASVYTEDFKGEYYYLPMEQLIPFKKQARKIFLEEHIDSLANSIKEHGIRQPLTVIKSEDEEKKFEIVSGERRYRAALKIGLKSVPCIIIKDRIKAEEIALIENIQREDLHPLELCSSFQSLIDNGICKNQREISEKIGLPRTSIVEIMQLSKLDENEKKIILEKNIRSRSKLRSILKKTQKERLGYIHKLNNVVQEFPEVINAISIKIKDKKIIVSESISSVPYPCLSEIKQKLLEIANKI